MGVKIGSEVFYIEGNIVQRSDVVATGLRELGQERIIVLTLRSGKKISDRDACFTLQDLLIKLKREFEISNIKGTLTRAKEVKKCS